MPAVRRPQTEAEWRAFDRGEWPPKKAVKKTPVKAVKKAVKKTPVKAAERAPRAAARSGGNVALAEKVKPVKAVKPVKQVSRKPAARTAAEILLDEIMGVDDFGSIDDLDTLDDLDDDVDDEFDDDDESDTAEGDGDAEPVAPPVVGLRGCEVPRIYTPARIDPETGEPRVLTDENSDGFAAIKFAEDILGMTLFPWQKWLLIHALELNDDYTYRFRTVIMSQSRQNGKALDVDTPILTTNGWSTMGGLCVGDQVFHPDGHPTQVVGAFDVMYDHDCYEVTTSDGRSVVADADHLWTVQDRRRSKTIDGVKTRVWETLTTAQLLERGDIVKTSTKTNGSVHSACRFRLPRQHRIVSKPVDLPIDPYVLGAWLGDGTSIFPQLTVGDSDLAAMRKNLTDCGMRIVSETRGRTAWTLRLNIEGATRRDGFQARLAKLGVLGDKHVPAMYLTGGTEQRKSLLAGLLDTDGFISKAGQVGFTSTNERLADAVVYLARSLGYRAVKRVNRSALNGHDYGSNYGVTFTTDEKVFRLARKNARVTEHVRDRNIISIKSITPVASRPVRCIKVDRKDGLFLAGDGLMPTHNTFIMVVLALWHLYCKGSRTVIATAQDLSKAEDAWAAAVEMAQDDEELNELIRKISLAHPKLLKVLNPITNKNCSYRVASKSRGGGRGFSGDLVLLDELREHHSFDSWGAVTKTQMARPRAQCWAFTNAGDAMSVVWRYQRALAHRDLGWPDGDADADVLGTPDPETAKLFEQLEKELGKDFGAGWFEWSAPPNAARSDRNAWAQANGSMNYTELVEDCITESAIAHALHTDPVATFDQEVMCRYTPFATGGPFPDGKWRDTNDDKAMPAADAKSMMCVEVSTTRSASVIVKAALDDNGHPVVGVDEMQPGTDWVVKYLLEQRSSFAGVVVRAGAGSPVLSLLQELTDAGLPVVEWKGSDIGAAWQALFDKVKDEKIRHLTHSTLDAAACSAMIKVQSAGGWIVDPVNSPSDVAPLYGVAGVVWGLNFIPDTGPSMYSREGASVFAF